MDRIQLYIKGLSYSQAQTGAHALVLGERKGDRKLPIIIGGFEAQSIAIALEKEISLPRPFTHDLFKNFADNFGIRLKEVIIHKLQDGVFFSILVCDGENNKDQIIDARTSDAVALAVRFKCPIYTYKEILDKAGIILKEIQVEKKASTKRSSDKKETLSNQSLNDLYKLMDRAVKDENYELAARIRDEIDRKKK